jgi:endoglucanase Acf2
MLSDLRAAVQKDIHYSLPDNYMRGAGDTYFSGKMLAKLARIILIAQEVGGVSRNDFSAAVGRLRAGVEIWLNGSAESPLLYDRVSANHFKYKTYLCSRRNCIMTSVTIVIITIYLPTRRLGVAWLCAAAPTPGMRSR